MEKKYFNFESLFTYKTDLNADSVEWCPHTPNQNVFVCGNYQLVEQRLTPSKRLGKILLFTFSKENGLVLHQTVDCPGILDQKWCHKKINGQSVLGVATSNGQIDIYVLSHSGGLLLKILCSCPVTSPDILLLSLDWSTGNSENNKINIVCSDSRGTVHLLRLCESSCELLNSWKSHINNFGTYEAWIAGFNYWDSNVFFSGGDDGIFFMYDTRVGRQIVGKNKCHSAGVTSIHSNASKEHILATGSYDQQIRLWDIRNIKAERQKVQMPGEVWRLKWDPFKQVLLLAACMYKGIHIVNFESIDEGMLVGSYYEHTNISYGVDWSYLNQNCPEFVIASCSFYDNLLCISEFHNTK